MDRATSDPDPLLEQRSAVVEFGRTALSAESIDHILTRACALCSAALGTDLSKVMRLEDDGTNLRVIAGVGWKDGVIGEEVVPALSESSEGFALNNGLPAVSQDIGDEDRFDYPDFLRRHGVEALVNVLIPGADGDPPYGLLQVDSRDPREFTGSEIEFLQGYANILGSAIVRFRKSEDLATALRQKERALEELQHRVKNNLAVLQGMLRARSRAADHPLVVQELALVSGNVETLAHLHDLLSSASNIDEIEIGAFLGTLCTRLGSFGTDQNQKCSICIDVEPALVRSSVAIPVGIIVNEFVTNAIKYATIDGLCCIHLAVERANRTVAITIRDEGEGYDPTNPLAEPVGSGLGLRLIKALGAQIDATLAWDASDGTRLRIEVPVLG